MTQIGIAGISENVLPMNGCLTNTINMGVQ
jgi:hypothetical protein